MGIQSVSELGTHSILSELCAQHTFVPLADLFPAFDTEKF